MQIKISICFSLFKKTTVYTLVSIRLEYNIVFCISSLFVLEKSL